MKKKIAILGAGESGTGAALLAHAQGWDVWVSDAGTIQAPYKQALLAQGIALEEGNHTPAPILAAQVVIKSPGIPNQAPILHTIQQAQVPILDEVAFAARYTNACLIAITGSNGKTTTTHLTHHILQAAGLNVAKAGNVGSSFARQVLTASHDYYVLELSSFQLEHRGDLRPTIACLLNITPHHLDRYAQNMDSYIQTKFRILSNMTEQDHFIYNQDDPSIQHYLPTTPVRPQQHPISCLKTPACGAYQQSGFFHINLTQPTSQFPTTLFQLPGAHHAYNALAAISIARLVGVSPAAIQAALPHFTGLPHRTEWVTTTQGIAIYNDSKATNVAAAYAALASFHQPIIWIAGGQDTGNDYTPLQPLVQARVKALIALGKDTTALQNAFQQVPQQYATQHITQALAQALQWATPGDIILLAPACASFDLFHNFEDRGEQFKQAVFSILPSPTCL